MNLKFNTNMWLILKAHLSNSSDEIMNQIESEIGLNNLLLKGGFFVDDDEKYRKPPPILKSIHGKEFLFELKQIISMLEIIIKFPYPIRGVAIRDLINMLSLSKYSLKKIRNRAEFYTYLYNEKIIKVITLLVAGVSTTFYILNFLNN